MKQFGTNRSVVRSCCAAIAALCLLSGGCGSQAWKRYSESRANPVTWVRDLFPPEGEYFYNEQSHEIERSLSRRQNVEISQ